MDKQQWTLLRGTGHETTHNQSHLQLIIYFWAEVWPVADYANIDIFQWNKLYKAVRWHICLLCCGYK